MSGRDRDRLKVLHEAARGHLTQPQAGGQLRLSARWVRELVARLRQGGDGGILHGLRGRARNREQSP
jgi:DNA-binding Lrp family transcriptional regulator